MKHGFEDNFGSDPVYVADRNAYSQQFSGIFAHHPWKGILPSELLLFVDGEETLNKELVL